jgi:hypothetical protein
MNQMITVTTRCSEWKHSEFRLEFDSAIPQADVYALVSFLEESVQAGTRYDDGQMIEFGSMILRLAVSDDVFIVEEPDLRTFPISWKVGITQSMRLLRLQKDIAESVGLGDHLEFSSIRCSLLVGTDLIEGLDMLILERSEPHASDSGWFVGRLDTKLDYNDAANLHRISVYQAILNWPRMAGFLALPAGSRVETSERLTISRNGQPLEIQKGSFLDVASI